MKKGRIRRGWIAGILCAITLASGGTPKQVQDPLAVRGYSVTSGAALGYVEDRVCASCHADLFASYQDVAMAKAFYAPRADRVIEDFEHNRYYHPKSKRYYEMSLQGDEYIFRRFQIGANRQRVNVFEQKVDWILGSGNHSRTYLYRTPGGELYQLPIAWYTQPAKWGMAPGFDRPDHEGVNRRVRRECMFCHNAYPNVPAGSDLPDQPQIYPEELPEGLGCQRCHGPGAQHARIAMADEVDFGRLAESLVDLGSLPTDRRNEICYSCHMQPSVAIPGVRRFGRGDYSFRPGQRLSDYLFEVDVDEEGRVRSERFEINHHPYRLEQSKCFVESAGALSCLTCHDPHRKVAPEERVAHYRKACQSCHEVDACTSPSVRARAVETRDCVACHMPPRRPQDVVHVVMTDHLIRPRPADDDLLAPLEESTPVILDVMPLDPARSPPGELVEIYRTLAVIQAGGGRDSIEHLEKLLSAREIQEIDPFLALARGQLRHAPTEKVRHTLHKLLRKYPEQALFVAWSGIAASLAGKSSEAIAFTRRAIAMRPDQAESHFNLGLLLERTPAAEEELEKALALRPNMVSAQLHLGHTLRELERLDEAIESYGRTLELDPTNTDAYLALSWTQSALGRQRDAIDTLRHGIKVASRPADIKDALAKLSQSR